MNNRKAIIALAVLLIGGFFLVRWLYTDQGGFKPKGLKVNAIGEDGVVMVVCDEDIWNDTMQSVMNTVFGAPFPGLAATEPFYRGTRIDPSDFKGKLTSFNLLVFISPLNKKGKTSKLVGSVLNDTLIRKGLIEDGTYFKALRDPWAEGQLAVFFYEDSAEALAEKLINEKERFLSYFYKVEQERIANRLEEIGENPLATKYLKDNWNLDITIPEVYDLKYKGEDVCWIHRDDAKKSLNLLVHEYPAEGLPTESFALSYQDSISKTYTPGPNEGSYRVVERRFEEMLPVSEYREVGGMQALVQRGNWRLENGFMGGPFVLYSIYDQQAKKVYVLEGFVHNPNESKRNLIRELEALIASARPI